MARKKRPFNTFNLSFLDIMSCGFGAVVLVFLIMNHALEVEQTELNQDLLSEVNLLEEDVADGTQGLVRLRNTLSDVDLKIVDAQGLAERITAEKDEFQALIEELRREGRTEPADIQAMQAEVSALEQEVTRLRQDTLQGTGDRARAFLGEGSRQYLTGLNLGGSHVAILFDASSSMLADKLVNIFRLRLRDEQVQRQAEKWVRSLATVDWLTAQLPVASHYQVFTFNTQARPALPGTEGKWLEAANQAQLQQLSSELRKLTPRGGTSLENAFLALQTLSPPPDNIFLVTDGLPTQGTKQPRGDYVNGATRQKLFRQAVKQLPSRTPINIILAPMDGDPMAASEFWQLAQVSRGALLAPSRDWP